VTFTGPQFPTELLDITAKLIIEHGDNVLQVTGVPHGKSFLTTPLIVAHEGNAPVFSIMSFLIFMRNIVFVRELITVVDSIDLTDLTVARERPRSQIRETRQLSPNSLHSNRQMLFDGRKGTFHI
jgi:hypothetical protein